MELEIYNFSNGGNPHWKGRMDGGMGGNTLEERCDRGIDKYGFLSRACLETQDD